MIDVSVRLRRAIYKNDVPLVRRIIKANPRHLTNPNFEDKSNTSLHIAAQHGLVEIAELLLDSGHDDEEVSRNADWDTPLVLAAANGQVEVGRLLIERCARCIPWPNKRGLDALATACRTPTSTPLIPLLLSHPSFPASPHARDAQSNTPLHHASAAGSLKALRILLQAGADPNATNAEDWTPLAYSQTVAAEVYLKNLIADIERDREAVIRGDGGSSVLGEGESPVLVSSPAQMQGGWSAGAGGTGTGRRKGAVRLITGDDVGSATTTGLGVAVDGYRPGSSNAGAGGDFLAQSSLSQGTSSTFAPPFVSDPATRNRTGSGPPASQTQGPNMSGWSPVAQRRAMTPNATRGMSGWNVNSHNNSSGAGGSGFEGMRNRAGSGD